MLDVKLHSTCIQNPASCFDIHPELVTLLCNAFLNLGTWIKRNNINPAVAFQDCKLGVLDIADHHVMLNLYNVVNRHAGLPLLGFPVIDCLDFQDSTTPVFVEQPIWVRKQIRILWVDNNPAQLYRLANNTLRLVIDRNRVNSKVCVIV